MIWGNATGDDLRACKCELVFWGASNGTQEGIVICIKGSVNDFEKLYGPRTASPITNNRTNLVDYWRLRD